MTRAAYHDPATGSDCVTAVTIVCHQRGVFLQTYSQSPQVSRMTGRHINTLIVANFLFFDQAHGF